jgi:3-phosphoinositide dependent protein kinase-1
MVLKALKWCADHAFKDFVLDLAPNGDLQSRISRLGSLSVECTRFYMAQVIDGLQWMHNKGVLHR